MPTETLDDYTTFGTLRVPQPASLPDVVDVFIAGGGPAGTAASVRAGELGLSALVIDQDDLMSRIRDYQEGKPIKPSYGGGDKIPFPPGGDGLASLHFGNVSKEEMVGAWKRRYKELSLAAKIGSELTGLEPAGDGAWSVKTWSHRAAREITYRARHVVVAVGGGIARRFDIPGNLDGIAFRLTRAEQYAGAPALVVGGGTSAAEAVIAISNAKAAAGDETAVYWSYRGDKMPKVSKALSEEFFDAYVGNGNVKYLSFSEPVAVVVGPDGQEVLSVRVDRKAIVGRPTETVHLEFPKHQVIACVGQDLPVKFLQGLGIKVVLVNDVPMMLVNRDGETSLPGVFLAGDVRGERYLRCTDFHDSKTCETVRQRRNIKAAMWDAVQAIDAIAHRLGKAVTKAAAPPVSAEPSAPPSRVTPPRPFEPAQPEHVAQLMSLLPDGTPEEPFPISKGSLTIGRKNADVLCPEDVYMADRHARIDERSGRYVLTDASDGAGVWIRIQGSEGRPLRNGDLVWAGAQILMASEKDGRWSIDHYDHEGTYQSSHAVTEAGICVGRRSGASPGREVDVTLDPADRTLSRRHAHLRVEDGVLRVLDLGSRNGTFVKLTEATPLRSGDSFRAGGKEFRFESFAAVEKLEAADVVVDAPQPAEAPSGEAPGAQILEGMMPVAIEHPEHAVSFGVAPGQDILRGFLAHLKASHPGEDPEDHTGQPLDWSCKTGQCGLCAVQVLTGGENFESIDPGSAETSTLKRGQLDPGICRLACMARVKGPVKLAVPE